MDYVILQGFTEKNINVMIRNNKKATPLASKMAIPLDFTDRVANTPCRKLLETAKLITSTDELFHSLNTAVQKPQPTVTRQMTSFQTATVHQPPLAAANRFLS